VRSSGVQSIGGVGAGAIDVERGVLTESGGAQTKRLVGAETGTTVVSKSEELVGAETAL